MLVSRCGGVFLDQWFLVARDGEIRDQPSLGGEGVFSYVPHGNVRSPVLHSDPRRAWSLGRGAAPSCCERSDRGKLSGVFAVGAILL